MATNSKPMVLDCTLRDGGYYTTWDFDDAVVETYVKAMSRLPVDFVEVGYRSPGKAEYLGEYFYCPESTLEKVRSWAPGLRLSVMLNGKDCQPGDIPALLAPCRGRVELVRVVTAPTELAHAAGLLSAIRAMGFRTALNLMYLSRFEIDAAFAASLARLAPLVDYLYLVDSYGGLSPEALRARIRMVRGAWTGPLGFHGHDNIELAFANALVALEEGVSVIDATILGMGRGAGNLKTELFLARLAAGGGAALDFNALAEAVGAFTPLLARYGWGTNLAYMVAGLHNLPQGEVMDLLAKNRYTLDTIVRILAGPDARPRQEAHPDTAAALAGDPALSGKDLLIVGGGPSATRHRDAVRAWATARNLPIVHASTRSLEAYLDLPVPQFLCLPGNEPYRLKRRFPVEALAALRRFILPPFPREVDEPLPEAVAARASALSGVFAAGYPDAPLAMALEVARLVGAPTAFLIGFDGYDGHDESHRALSHENQKIIETYTAAGGRLASLVPSDYVLETRSVYAFLAGEQP